MEDRRCDGATVDLDIENDEFNYYVGTAPLAVKSWEGQVYLVPPADVAIFDEFGPVNEMCFARKGATLFPDFRSTFSARSKAVQTTR